MVAIISDLRELKIVEIDIRIFAYNNSPPTPHYVTEHGTEGKFGKKFINLWFEFLIFLIILEQLLIILILLTLSKTITVNKPSLKLLIVFRYFIECEKWWLFDIIIISRFCEIVSDVINGIIESRILIIDENVFFV